MQINNTGNVCTKTATALVQCNCENTRSVCCCSFFAHTLRKSFAVARHGCAYVESACITFTLTDYNRLYSVSQSIVLRDFVAGAPK